MDFGQFCGLPDQGVDGDDLTDIAEANKIIKQKNRSIRSCRFEMKEEVGQWKIYAAVFCVLSFLGGMMVHLWMDKNGHGACAPYDCTNDDNR